MHIILLSGGSGKRLWPLSNDVRSKQFLKLLRNENGELQSMVQRVYDNIKRTYPDCRVVIATGEAQKDAIRNQMRICGSPIPATPCPAESVAEKFLLTLTQRHTLY